MVTDPCRRVLPVSPDTLAKEIGHEFSTSVLARAQGTESTFDQSLDFGFLLLERACAPSDCAPIPREFPCAEHPFSVAEEKSS